MNERSKKNSSEDEKTIEDSKVPEPSEDELESEETCWKCGGMGILSYNPPMKCDVCDDGGSF